MLANRTASEDAQTSSSLSSGQPALHRHRSPSRVAPWSFRARLQTERESCRFMSQAYGRQPFTNNGSFVRGAALDAVPEGRRSLLVEDKYVVPIAPSGLATNETRSRRDVCFGILQTVAAALSAITVRKFDATIPFRGARLGYSTAHCIDDLHPNVGLYPPVSGGTYNPKCPGISPSSINASCGSRDTQHHSAICPRHARLSLHVIHCFTATS